MDIVFGICFYNDPSICRLLDSLPKEIDKIVLDGKFNGVDGKKISDGDIRERLTEYENLWLYNARNLTEVEKRNALLEICKQYKYMIIVDSDEYVIEADWDLFYNELRQLKSGIHQLILEDKGKLTSYGRIIVNPYEWEYVDCHNMLYNKMTEETKSIHNIEGKIIDSIILKQDNNMRSPEYMEMHDKYHKQIINDEIKIRGER